jgi:4,5-dihydroxyphthalate decarboxylase
METVRLSIALHDYDHVHDLTSGLVRPHGITLVPLQVPPHEMFWRFMTHHEWEVSEMSFGGYCSALAAGDDDMVAIPVFPSRVFRQSSIYVRDDDTVGRPEDLAGKRCGVPEWGMTAVIYERGWLMHQVGIPLGAIDWVQAGLSQAGRVEKVGLDLPDGVRCEIVADRSLTDMLLAGDIDAILTAAPPAPFRDGKPGIRRLCPDFRPIEEDYFRATGIYPIMHLIAIRRSVYDQYPWVALSLYDAFEEAKRRSIARVMAPGSLIAHPWGNLDAARIGAMMFGDGEYWPYGIEPNRVTLDAFLQYCHEQGVTRRRLAPEELFVRTVQDLAKE